MNFTIDVTNELSPTYKNFKVMSDRYYFLTGWHGGN